MTYGAPYQGSKNRIAKELIAQLPEGERFVDLFAGGCAMTHAAIASGKYKSFLVNDKYPYGLRLFKGAIEGEFNNPKYFRWIGREDFERERDTDPFVKLCFSFGHGGMRYMYNREIEPYKRAAHNAIVFDDWREFKKLCPECADEVEQKLNGMPHDNWSEIDARRLDFGRAFTKCVQEKFLNNNPLYRSLQPHHTIGTYQHGLTRLVSLEGQVRLGKGIRRIGLQHLDPTMRMVKAEDQCHGEIEFSEKDYRDYEHKEGDVVYCDPPYKGTEKYSGYEFDHDAFYEWVRTRDYPVYFSEYSAPDDFVAIWEKEMVKQFGSTPKSGTKNKVKDKLYIHRRFA